jgi:hypothetical protein
MLFQFEPGIADAKSLYPVLSGARADQFVLGVRRKNALDGIAPCLWYMNEQEPLLKRDHRRAPKLAHQPPLHR